MDNQVKLNLHEDQCITICKRGKNTFLDLTVNSLHQWFSNVKRAPDHLGGLLRHRRLGPTPVSDSVCLG